MATAEELCKVSRLTSELLSAIFEASIAANRLDHSDDELLKDRFVESLYAVEATANALLAVDRRGTDLAFAAVNSGPVEILVPVPLSSVHDAILDAGLDIGLVAFDVVRAGLPDFYEHGIEHPLPPLCAKDDLLRFVDVSRESFRKNFASESDLNRASALLVQELARAIRNAPQVEFEVKAPAPQPRLADGGYTSAPDKASIPNPPQPTPSIVVSLNPPEAEFNGVRYGLSGDGALFLQSVVKADGAHTTVPNIRTDRVRKKLPEALRALVVTDNKGAYIPRAKLWRA